MSEIEIESQLAPNSGEVDTGKSDLRAKIIHILSIYPKISPSMLQVSLGTSLPPKIWHPVFDQLLLDEVVSKSQITARSHIGRQQVYTIIQLSSQFISEP